jgi:hypothetical protein
VKGARSARKETTKMLQFIGQTMFLWFPSMVFVAIALGLDREAEA